MCLVMKNGPAMSFSLLTNGKRISLSGEAGEYVLRQDCLAARILL